MTRRTVTLTAPNPHFAVTAYPAKPVSLRSFFPVHLDSFRLCSAFDSLFEHEIAKRAAVNLKPLLDLAERQSRLIRSRRRLQPLRRNQRSVPFLSPYVLQGRKRLVPFDDEIREHLPQQFPVRSPVRNFQLLAQHAPWTFGAVHRDSAAHAARQQKLLNFFENVSGAASLRKRGINHLGFPDNRNVSFSIEKSGDVLP